MLGGEGNNILYDDTWYFNMTKMKWLLKERLELYSFPIRIYNAIYLYPLYLTYNVIFVVPFLDKRAVYPVYPDSCTDDLEYIEENNCTHLLWPKELQRDR